MAPRTSLLEKRRREELRLRRQLDADVETPEPSVPDGGVNKRRKADQLRRQLDADVTACEPSDLDEGSNKRRKGAQSKKITRSVKINQRSKASSSACDLAIQNRAVRPKAKNADVSKGKKVNTVVKADAEAVEQEEEERETGEDEEMVEEEELEEEEEELEENVNLRRVIQSKRGQDCNNGDCCFIGEPIEETEARLRWLSRFDEKGLKYTEENIKAKRHYLKAKVDNIEYDLYDDVYVQSEEGVPNFIGRIIEFFEGIDRKSYFTAQWYFTAEDTVIRKEVSEKHDKKRVFLSEEKNDNPLECLVSKIKIIRIKPNIDERAKEAIQDCNYYYDMLYDVAFSTFVNLPEKENEIKELGNISDSTISSIDTSNDLNKGDSEASSSDKQTLFLLDLYAGCGGMSTGLCTGAALSGVNLESRWAVDINESACESLQYNHPNTHVRNEKAENFLEVIKQWKGLCDKFNVYDDKIMNELEELDDSEDEYELEEGEFVVDKIINICYGDPKSKSGKNELKFLIRWKGYGPEEDTWEPVEGLDNCQEKLKKFVVEGYRNNILPLPGTVDVICGGPPCQGISGFNRFRDKNNPLADEKNSQLIVFMSIVQFLRPKYVLMENVVDMLKFSNGFLGRHAIGTLVDMRYQVRLGLMVAGRYGLPQFRMRMFLWGALPTQVLPQFPLPTHRVLVRGQAPTEFKHSEVGANEQDMSNLKEALVLKDAISDLPEVQNSEKRDKRQYVKKPESEFQHFVRLSRKDMLMTPLEDEEEKNPILYDHMPLNLNKDDYERTCKIPKSKGANFRDLPGLIIGPDDKVYRDANVKPQPTVSSGKLVVPNYAILFMKGKSKKPFGRLWWDEIIPTVVGRAEPHNQAILHPNQDRVLTIRENARLQGFPDFYKLFGNTKERYLQIGNAVAGPVARALGCALARAVNNENDSGPVFTLPRNFHSLGGFRTGMNVRGEVDE